VLIHENEKKRAQELLAGNDAHSKQFFDEFFPRLYRFAINRMSGDHEATREVVQNSLAKILLSLSKFRGDSSLFTWMCSICSNEISDFLKRRTKYRQSIVLESELVGFDGLPSAAGQTTPETPDDVYNRDQNAVAIHLALDKLPAVYGNVLEWKYIEGLSVSEMSTRLGLSHVATQSVLYRARMAFQEVFSNPPAPRGFTV
jgi:RNA polymerase sigma-70 factor (ECF subfamily)